MNFVEKNLQFGRLTHRTRTTRIVIHHTATGDVGIETLHNGHVRRGWAGVGYHYLVRANGDIEIGRPEWTAGTHAPGSNNISIGIAVTGNYSRTAEVPELQMKNLVMLVREMLRKYGHLEIVRHSDLTATQCPGTLFPWTRFLERVRG